jgi:hypothetical protein
VSRQNPPDIWREGFSFFPQENLAQRFFATALANDYCAKLREPAI